MSFSHDNHDSLDEAVPNESPILVRDETSHILSLHLLAEIPDVKEMTVVPESHNLKIVTETKIMEFNGTQCRILGPIVKIPDKIDFDPPEGAHIDMEGCDDIARRPQYIVNFTLSLPSETFMTFLSKPARWKVSYDHHEFELPALPLSACLISEKHFFVSFFNHISRIYFLPNSEKEFISHGKNAVFLNLQLYLIKDLINLVSSYLYPKFSSEDITKLVGQIGLFSQIKKQEEVDFSKKNSPVARIFG